eukprot:TRINITY_DN21033_c0_g1_i1.p1 TRINITY_DN21033_c0_g1~~TRINITY_DN21033_c0_g1_i1.p1  ORF type:complete len:109 (-),score=21.58 TRINITY_DN21033_c0_g1_i1:13-339(-)
MCIRDRFEGAQTILRSLFHNYNLKYLYLKNTFKSPPTSNILDDIKQTHLIVLNISKNGIDLPLYIPGHFIKIIQSIILIVKKKKKKKKKKKTNHQQKTNKPQPQQKQI